MTTTIQIQDSFQEYFSYLCVFSVESGELLEYVVNLDPINESYVNCHKAIQECSPSNVEMVLMDAQYKDIVSKVDKGAINKVTW